MHDFFYGCRVLRRSPGFAAVAVLSLALGIGANTAIFSVSRALFSDPLPVAHPERLFAVANRLTTPRGMPGVSQINGTSYRDPVSGQSYRAPMPYSAFVALRAAAGRDADLFGFTFVREANISIGGLSTTGAGVLVSGNYFSGSGAGIVLGRPIADGDDHPGASVAVISHRFWLSATGGDPSVLGKAIRFNGVPFTVVGVTAPGFLGMSRGGFFPPMDVTVPLQAQPAIQPDWLNGQRSLFHDDRTFWVHAMARLADGVTPATLQRKLAATFAQTLKSSNAPWAHQATGIDLRLLPGGRGVDELGRRASQPVQVLTAVVAIVLLLACVNLANLMLARGVARQKETSIRLALGSGRLRLVRQALIESLIVSAVGAGIGLFIGVAGGRALLVMLTASSGPVAMTIDANWGTLAVTATIACAATVVFGLAPTLRLLRRDVGSTLKTATTAGTGAPRLRAGALLMTLQVAISVPLVAGAAIFLRTVYNLGSVDLGFNPDRLVSFRIEPALNGYDRDRVNRTFARVLDRVRSVPGVTSATMMEEPLLTGWSSDTTFTRDDGSKFDLYYNQIGPDYFSTLNIPIVGGRAIDVSDTAAAPRVVVVNETAARAMFGRGPAVGRHVRVFTDHDVEVIGVVRDTKYDSVRKAIVPTMFVPYAQGPGVAAFGARAMYVLARTAAPPAALMGAIRGAASDVDRDVPVSKMKTQTEQIQETLGTELAFTRILVAFGAFAMFLACIGLHGVTAYSVARRTSEIGVRIALGAQRGDVFWLVLRQVVVITAAGLAVGIPVAIWAGRGVRALLFGVKPADPLSLAGAAIVMMVVAAVAGYLPARRAAGLDPLTALRVE
jgi:predicted permease